MENLTFCWITKHGNRAAVNSEACLTHFFGLQKKKQPLLLPVFKGKGHSYLNLQYNSQQNTCSGQVNYKSLQTQNTCNINTPKRNNHRNQQEENVSFWVWNAECASKGLLQQPPWKQKCFLHLWGEGKASENLEKIQHLQKRVQAYGWTLHFLCVHRKFVER